jgi:hypothetical protein
MKMERHTPQDWGSEVSLSQPEQAIARGLIIWIASSCPCMSVLLSHLGVVVDRSGRFDPFPLHGEHVPTPPYIFTFVVGHGVKARREERPPDFVEGCVSLPVVAVLARYDKVRLSVPAAEAGRLQMVKGEEPVLAFVFLSLQEGASTAVAAVLSVSGYH